MTHETFLCIGYAKPGNVKPLLVTATSQVEAVKDAYHELTHPPFNWKTTFHIVVCTRSSPNVVRTPWLPAAVATFLEETTEWQTFGVDKLEHLH